MPSKIIRLFWFISSYTPLWIILCISNWPMTNAQTLKSEGSWFLSIVFIVVSIISNAIVFWFLSTNRRNSAHHKGEIIEIKAIGDVSREYREYIVTYAISLIGFNLLEIKDVISFMILLAFFAFLYVKHDHIIYNPMLELLGGYKLYDIRVALIDLPMISDEYPTRTGTLISTNSLHDLEMNSVPFTEIGHGDLFVEVRA